MLSMMSHVWTQPYNSGPTVGFNWKHQINLWCIKNTIHHLVLQLIKSADCHFSGPAFKTTAWEIYCNSRMESLLFYHSFKWENDSFLPAITIFSSIHNMSKVKCKVTNLDKAKSLDHPAQPANQWLITLLGQTSL